jgi:hypothetical protein
LPRSPPEPIARAAHAQRGPAPYRRQAAIAAALTLLIGAVDCAAQRPIIYKCTQPDGRTEYSHVPCGPGEHPDYITGDNFSVIVPNRVGPQPAIPPPLSPRAISRQRFMQREARQYSQPR